MPNLSDAQELQINLDGRALEIAGRIDEAIALYEYGVANQTRTPGTYTRLLALYWKAKRPDDERRVCELAARRWPTARDVTGTGTFRRLASLPDSHVSTPGPQAPFRRSRRSTSCRPWLVPSTLRRLCSNQAANRSRYAASDLTFFVSRSSCGLFVYILKWCLSGTLRRLPRIWPSTGSPLRRRRRFLPMPTLWTVRTCDTRPSRRDSFGWDGRRWATS